VRTLIVSDLHLGSSSRADLLRRAELREPLLDALQDVERLVLLGDVLELRHGPRREALAAARPFFEDLGRAFAGREIVVVGGNHDHALPAALGVEQRFAAGAASTMMAQLAEWAAPARLTAAYPGLWVRPDVYATHGHYLDCHLTIPTLERLGIGAMGRILRRPARSFTGAEDYEAVTVPVFEWIDAVARQASPGDALNGGMTVRAWRAFAGHGNHDHQDGRNGQGRGARTLARRLRTRTITGSFPLLVATLNRAGLGPFNTDLSIGELRRAGLRAMGEVTRRLDLVPPHPAYVVFGHTHRAGPLPGDPRSEWLAPTGARMVNVGSWVHEPGFLGEEPQSSPYRPGFCAWLADQSPPELRCLLDSSPGVKQTA
jgi:hypothetical protein